MIKKTYEKPTMQVVKIQHSQMLCASLTEVQATGLGEESINYGDGDNKSGNVWDDAM